MDNEDKPTITSSANEDVDNQKQALSNVVSPSPSEEDELLEGSDNDESLEYSEEASESESEIECDIWDDDCTIIARQQRKNAVNGYFLIPTCFLEQDVPNKKLQKIDETICLNDALLNEEFVDSYKHHWAKPANFQTKSVEFITDPFKLCIIDNFIENNFVLNELRKEMNEIDWNKRYMDLYEFFQSKDLSELNDTFISNFHKFLKTDAMAWIQNLTGLEFYKVSATCSFYSDTDYLLLHDDLQEDRSIAFIFYLLDPTVGMNEESWTNDMGGALEIFNKDEKGQPSQCARQITPKNNRFVFFKVTNDSYHQVSEVLNMNNCRLSINGWFHTRNVDQFIAPVLESPKTGLFTPVGLPPIDSQLALDSWIAKVYLEKSLKEQIQKQMEWGSEISLQDFFIADKLEMLTQALKNNDITWNSVGPPNRMKYEVISTETMPQIVSDFLALFQSMNMFYLLHEFTALDLNTNIFNNIKPTFRFELQKWKPGCYSLLSEYDWENERELDIVMYIGTLNDMQLVGGQTLYVCTNEKVGEAIITLPAEANILNLVFRDTARIMKHVSKRSQSDCFYMLVCSYKEDAIPESE